MKIKYRLDNVEKNEDLLNILLTMQKWRYGIGFFEIHLVIVEMAYMMERMLSLHWKKGYYTKEELRDIIFNDDSIEIIEVK